MLLLGFRPYRKERAHAWEPGAYRRAQREMA